MKTAAGMDADSLRNNSLIPWNSSMKQQPIYEIKTTYFCHKLKTSTRRRLAVLKQNGNPIYALLMYQLEETGSDYDYPHRNSKKPGKYSRTMKSTIDRAKTLAGKTKISANDIIQDSIHEAGGYEKIKHDGSFLRNQQQVYNIIKSMDKATNNKDELTWLLKEKESMDSPIQYIHMSKACHLSVVLASQFQLDLLKDLCCGDQNCILGIDMTYNCGKYYVTPTTILCSSIVEPSWSQQLSVPPSSIQSTTP